MKITLLRNLIKDNATVTGGISLVKIRLASINFPVEITEKTIDRNFSTFAFSNPTIGSGNCVNPIEILQEVTGSEDIAFLIFNNEGLNPKPLNPLHSNNIKGKATPCQMCEEWYEETTIDPNNPPESVFSDFFLHEICHAMYYLLQIQSQDKTHFQAQDPAYSQKSNNDWYLHLITTLMPAWNIYAGNSQTMEPYIYFKLSESTGGNHTVAEMDPVFMKFLDHARGLAKTPFKINSGKRTPEENATVNGAPNSAHLRGLAADLYVKDNFTRDMILRGIYATGMPCFVEIAKGHVHVDMDSTIHPLGQTMWSIDD